MLSWTFIVFGLEIFVFLGFVLSAESDGCDCEEELLLLKETVVDVHRSSSSSSTVKLLPFWSPELEEERDRWIGFLWIWILGFGVGSYTSESFGLPQRQPATLALIMVVRSFFFLLDEDIEVGGGGRYKETPYCLGLSALRERERVCGWGSIVGWSPFQESIFWSGKKYVGTREVVFFMDSFFHEGIWL